MKAGIVTLVGFENYGNRLQNYALSHILKSRFSCDAVTLRPMKEQPFYNGNYAAWLKEKILQRLCVFPAAVEKKYGAKFTRWASFHKWNRHIPTRVMYGCEHIPAAVNDRYDCFFVGSDQVWNYRACPECFPDFFLKFADGSKKAAISASFGVDAVPEAWKEIYVEGLKDFAHLSVRENAGRAIVKELTGKDVPVLVDPVMVLNREEWMKVSEKPRVDCSKCYVLKYYLGDDSESALIDAWAEENGYEVYELLNESVPELYSAGPGEFISLISNADLVCSDSFHCIAFSIIFSRPFVVYARQGAGDYMSSRLTTLLDKFGFQNRWKHLVHPEDYLKCDFSHVGKILEKERNEFLKYVGDVLRSR